MTHKRGVLWDLDGVLVDTGELHFQAWSEALPEFGLEMTREFFAGTFGMNNAGVLTELLGHPPEPDRLAEISEYKERLFREAVRGNVTALPGVRTWLERLAAEGVPQAIATSAPPENIDVMVDGAGLRAYFDAIVSGFEMPAKPDPAVFLEAAHRIGVSPERCVVVEDAIAGVEAAKRAGMRCIAVTTTNPAEALQDADIVVDRLDKLPENAFQQLWTETQDATRKT